MKIKMKLYELENFLDGIFEGQTLPYLLEADMEVEDKTNENPEELLIDCGEDVVEEDEDHRIIVELWHVNVPELGIRMHQGIFEQRYEGEEELVPDFDLVAFFNLDDNSRQYIYFEQDSFGIALYNFCRAMNIPKAVGQLECELVFEGFEFE